MNTQFSPFSLTSLLLSSNVLFGSMFSAHINLCSGYAPTTRVEYPLNAPQTRYRRLYAGIFCAPYIMLQRESHTITLFCAFAAAVA